METVDKQKVAEAKELVRQTYEMWRQHPGTRLFLNAVIARRDNYMSSLGNDVLNVKDQPDEYFRLTVAFIKAYDAIIAMADNVELVMPRNLKP